MRNLSEQGSTFSKTASIMIIVGLLAGYGVYLTQKALNDIYAENILNGVWEQAKQEKDRIVPRNLSEEEEEESIYNQSKPMEHKGYGFVAVSGSTSTLVKIETEKKAISSGICKALKKKFKESMWWDAFAKVVVVDRMGDEKTDVLIYDCPREKIPALRFYVKFAESNPESTETTQEVTEEQPVDTYVAPAPISVPKTIPTPTNTPRVQPSYSHASCPSGTSSNGLGGIATSGCRCYRSGEVWNGKSCEAASCPTGSSKNPENKGDRTNVSGCRCNDETPVWSLSKKTCIGKCTGDKIIDTETGKCVCPGRSVVKTGTLDSCVECNQDTDCHSDFSCINNQCMGKEEYEDCRWGICQTCDKNGVRQNILGDQFCEVAGLKGQCNNNGTCYPTEGRRCSSVRGCRNGEFCNYGGDFNSSKRQNGKFGQTPNVCQIVTPQKFTYKKIVYYYNSEKDLKSWCRAANNKANCLWGYLAKPGAISWCTSLGKRLLTKSEMSDVWSELKKVLPQTYRGYAYWVEEGVWIEDFKGRRALGTGHSDGYGGRAGVVCK